MYCFALTDFSSIMMIFLVTRHIVYSHYNSSAKADAQIRASSSLSELVSIRDGRQLFFGYVAFIKAELAGIVNLYYVYYN